MQYESTLAFAQAQDASDPLKSYRDQFHFPKLDTPEMVYFSGHSLGLQPKTAKAAVELELDDWAKYGVEGHFHATNPWYSYHENLTPPLAQLVGAKESEVVCLNSLTTNLHLLFVSFYRPTKARYKIISEAKMFPSDRYLLETQAQFHGFDPDDAIIEIGAGSSGLSTRPIFPTALFTSGTLRIRRSSSLSMSVASPIEAWGMVVGM